MNDSKNRHTREPLALARLLSLILLSLGSIANVALAQDADAGVAAPSETPPAEATPPPAPPAETAPAETAPAEATPPGETVIASDTVTSADGTTTTTTTVSDAEALGTATTTTTAVAPDGTAVTDSTTVATTSGNADEVAEEVQSAREPLAWRNSYFNYSLNTSLCSFSRDCQLSPNPTVYSFLSLSPRWYLDSATFFSFYQALYIEHTNDDGATYQHEAQLFDTRISLVHREGLGDNFIVLPSVGVWIPVSKASQAQQRYFRAGAGISATWNPNVAGFNLSVAASYYRWFGASNVALTGSPYAGRTTLAAPNGDPSANQASSVTGETDRITLGTTINWTPLEGFTITLQVFYFWINGYNATTATIPVMGADTITLTDNSSHWRANDSYSIYFQYDFVPWFQGWIGLSNSTQIGAVFSPDGSLRSPVNLYDMQVSIGATVTLDSLYEQFATTGEDDGLTPEQRQRRRQGLATRSSSGGSL